MENYPIFKTEHAVKNKGNKNNLHLAQKYAGILILSFRAWTLSVPETRTDYVCKQILVHIFDPNGGYCLFIPGSAIKCLI